jgi:fibronectin-binding autotransporter adhesin
MSFRSKIRSAILTPYVVRGAALIAALGFVSIVHGAQQYWDANGSTAGLGGAGTWSATTGGTGNWNDSSGTGARQDWADGNDALFNGTAGYTVTQSGNFAPNSLSFGVTAGNVIITGGTLTIGATTDSIVMKTNVGGSARAQVIRSVIAGTDIMVTPDSAGTVNSFLEIGANPTGVTNTFTGDLIFGGSPTASVGFSQIGIENPTALPQTAGVEVRMRRNQSQLLFGGGGAGQSAAYTATFNNNIILNDGQPGRLTQGIGSFANGSVITLTGVISGDANLIFQLGNGGGQGRIILNNTETYTGFTQISIGGVSSGAGSIALGQNDVFPVGTTLQAGNGNFDMNGKNQRVATLTNPSGGTGALSCISSTGALSTLTIDGNLAGEYSGLIGANTPARLPGSTDNVAITLASTNTGTLTLRRGLGNTYSGGTIINGGKLIAANDPGGLTSATGTGSVAVNNGGTLGGGGAVGGAITVASGGHIAPSGVYFNGTTLLTNTIGPFSALGALTLNSGSRLDIELGAPVFSISGASDSINMPNAGGLSVPAGASTIGVNLSDPAGGAAGNGTYTIMTFQPSTFPGASYGNQFFTSGSPSPNSLNGATIAYHLADASLVNQDATPANATRVIMTVTGGPNALTWSGVNGPAWDTGITSNFNSQSTATNPTTFASNDNVVFDDGGANTNPVNVAGGGVQPNVVTINNSGTPYSFIGGDIKGSSVGGTGGLILAGVGAVTISNKYTAVGPIISNKSGAGTATLAGDITAATSLTVNGGAITLSGANTYSGNNIVNGGSLTASGATATFGTGNVTVNAGNAAILAGVTNAIANSATLTLLGGGTAATADAGYINLATGINERVASLVLGSTTQVSGLTYGSSTSGAMVQNNEYFLGDGLISVSVPGDFNGDGTVNAGDYVLWRKSPSTYGGNPAGYNLWKANFGAIAGAGTGGGLGGTNVPEPGAISLVLAAIGSVVATRRRVRR